MNELELLEQILSKLSVIHTTLYVVMVGLFLMVGILLHRGTK